MKNAKLVLVFLSLFFASLPGRAISVDPLLTSTCVQGNEFAYLPTQFWYPSNCGTAANNMQVNSTNWTKASPYQWTASAQDYLPCAGNNGSGRYYLEYQSNNFMYGGAKDCSTDLSGTFTAIAHAQSAVSGFVGGIPSNLKLYDSAHPYGYRLSAMVAINGIGSEAGQAGFARVALIYHLHAGTGSSAEDIYAEFDAFDSASVYTNADGTWIFEPVKHATGAVYQRRQFWAARFASSGKNLPAGVWTTLCVDTTEVGAILGRYRPDLNQADVTIVQVYTAMELKGAFGHLQTKSLTLDYAPATPASCPD